MNAKLKAILEQSAANLILFGERAENEILDAWSKAETEAQLQETKPTLKLGYTIALDLDKDAMTTTLAWNVRHKVEGTEAIPDPEQLKLPMEPKPDDDTEIEIKTAGSSVTTTAAQFRKLQKSINGKN